ncbi:MAG: dihydroneopterin aldolase [Chlamydiales bacterium]|nr:dihydroneopterin aldolase [Chlamydiales bacterium]
MEGTIKIEDFRIHCTLGAHAYERKVEQELSLDLEMRLNLAEPVRTDSIVDTVDYEAVCALCKELAQTRRYHLIETFAYEALHAILEAFPLTWAKVRVRKPGALPLARYAVVEFDKVNE